MPTRRTKVFMPSNKPKQTSKTVVLENTCDSCKSHLVQFPWGQPLSQQYLTVCDNPNCPRYRNPVSLPGAVMPKRKYGPIQLRNGANGVDNGETPKEDTFAQDLQAELQGLRAKLPHK